MWRSIQRFFTNINWLDATALRMSKLRYFPNPAPDYNGQETGIDIPQDFLLKSIDSIVANIEKAVKPIDKNGSDGIYLGTAGIAYMYYYLSKHPVLGKQRNGVLTKAIEYLTPALHACKRTGLKDTPSLILGNCGVYAVASAVYSASGDKSKADNYRKMYNDSANICKEVDFLGCGSDELFVGRAGYILGALWLAKETNSDLPINEIYTLCNIIIESGRQYTRRHGSPCPLMYSYYKVEYLGAAHGLCSILQAILTVPDYLDKYPAQAKDVKASVDYLLSLQDKEGNFPCATDEIGGNSELVHWCHGAPGMIYLMGRSYLIWQETKYLQSCEKMAELIWLKGLLKKGSGICHGVAGNGYAFLLLYRLTENPKYLYRAIAFAKFLETPEFIRGARTPDYPFSLYEGVAGTACFLADLMCPKQAVFPFSDVFY